MRYSKGSLVSIPACLPFAHFSVSAVEAQEQTEISKYGAWEIQCAASTSNVKTCALVQKVISEEQQSVGIMVAIREVPAMPNGAIQIFARGGD